MSDEKKIEETEVIESEEKKEVKSSNKKKSTPKKKTTKKKNSDTKNKDSFENKEVKDNLEKQEQSENKEIDDKLNTEETSENRADKAAEITNTEEEKGKIVILLPSYNPDEKLVKCVNSLIDAGFDEIVVVDDGGKDESQKYFDEIKDKVHIVRHAVNQGKGRALKTGLNYAKLTYENLLGVIAADGDGQHPVEAIVDCRDAMIKNPDKLILNVRKFAKGNVPLANLTGNLLTIGVFLGLTQVKFSDTQCGLRGFPINVIDDMIETNGERFEYESNMLIDVRKKSIDFVEVPMDAIYIEDNQTSHFNKVTDSISIYRNIFKFALFPIISGVLSFLFSYIYFMNLGCLAERNILLTYGSGALLSWLLLSFTIKNERKLDTLFIILWSVISTFIFYGIYKWLYDYAGAWWLSAIVIAPISYAIYLRARYGKKPRKTKYTKEEQPKKEKKSKKNKNRDKK